MKKKLYIEFVFLIFLGAITSLSLPPNNFFIINFFSLSLFFVFLIRKSNKKNNFHHFIYGWLFGFGYFLSNLYWISISLSHDANFKFLIPLTIILIPSFLAIFYGIVTYLFFILKQKTILSSILTFSLIFGIIEFIRGSILTGFPWNLFAYSFSNQLEVLSVISIVGTYGFNLFCISLFLSPALLIIGKNKIQDLSVCILFLVLTSSFYIYGSFYKEKFNQVTKINYNFKIRVIGSNISLDRFYQGVDTFSIIKDLINISDPILNEKTIFIWPEGIIPNISQNELVEYEWLFSDKFNKNHLLIVGINNEYTTDEINKYYNSFTVYDNKLNVISSYNKINLVPFGEFLPFENILRSVGLKSLTNNYQSYSSGNKREIIKIKHGDNLLKVLPLICYEIIYSGNLFDKPDFDLIINISEDGWFGQSVGPRQHFTHSIFRAIESGKYVLRSANNGISAIINPLGEVEKRVSFGESGYVDFESQKKVQPTLFSKYGNLIFVFLILLYIFLILSFNRIKNE
ncbi:apolipoprotein N-acyltransferase [Candidatus Pelagibacter sp.]|nr:apolipoprotein N-acyltransferase [Candidatus Pelagibacter sp.]